MIDTNTLFTETSKKEWIDQLTKDLKGKPIDILNFKDEIEDIAIPSYQHQVDDKHLLVKPGEFPFERGLSRTKNDWTNGIQVVVSNEKEANAFALAWLMKGVNYLHFVPAKEQINWQVVFEGIGFEHIRSHFAIDDIVEIKKVIALTNPSGMNTSFGVNSLAIDPDFIGLLSEKQLPLIEVNAFELHQAGSSSAQEIGFALNEGHGILVSLMNNGMTVDQAAACLHFQFGIGRNYLIESIKFNVFRSLWSQVIKAYNPQHGCSYRAEITAVVGHMNKSLKDPYTNLLRQTTEALSAVNGGVNNLLVKPYDQYSTQPSELAQRMAINISLLLAEESHLDKVIDPMGGSYVQDALFDKLSNNAWNYFLDLEKCTGDEKTAYIHTSVNEKRSMRIQALIDNSNTLIGVNKFLNPDTVSLEWIELPNQGRCGLTPLVLEKEMNA